MEIKDYKMTFNGVVVDLTEVYKAEARISEIAFVTPQKAPELLALFNKIYLTLATDVGVKVQSIYDNAVRHAERVRATVLLDKVPVVLAERGLTSARSPLGSEDVREAILALDEGYSAARDSVDAAGAALELIKGKVKSIEMAYNSVKKVLGESAFNFRNPNLVGGSDNESREEASPVRPTSGTRSQFGKARF